MIKWKLRKFCGEVDGASLPKEVASVTGTITQANWCAFVSICLTDLGYPSVLCKLVRFDVRELLA